MKAIIRAAGIAAIICTVLCFAACKMSTPAESAPTETPTESPTEYPAATEAAAEPLESAYQEQDLPISESPNAYDQAAAEPFMRLYSFGMEVPTREFYFHSSTAFYQDGKATGMLKGDGIAFFDPDHIASAYDELPSHSLCRAEGLDIRLSDGSRISYIYVYDPANGFERTTLHSKAELDKLIIGSAADHKEYVVEVIVTHEGDYIEELDECESVTNSYAFIIK